MNRKSMQGTLILLLTAMIWGGAAVAQNIGMDYVGPFTFNGLRTLIGAAVLLPVVLIRDRVKARREECADITPDQRRADRRLMWKAGILTGLSLFIPASMQQIALVTTSAGKTGFITAMYIVAVPLLGLLIGKRTNWAVWVSVVIALAGMYLLCVTERLTIASGDVLLLISTVFWGVQILVIDHYAARVDCLKLVLFEFLVTGLLSLPPMLIFEHPDLAGIAGCIVPLLYAGVLSCGVAYTLQPVGQKYTDPTVASIVMSLESVFAALSGFLILHERMTVRELVGCLLMFAAVMLSQLAPVKDADGENAAEQ